MQIRSENLTYTYGANSAIYNKALNGVDLLIKEGAFFGIIGKTGSGKSTFIQHLNGLIKIQKNCGKITVGEFDLSDKKCQFKKLRSKVGMVFQYPEQQLFAETVFEDVAFGIKNFMPEKTEQEIFEMVKNAIELVGLNFLEVKDKSPFELSGGQRRRVAIAGVISARPEVLVLDEPVAGLDPVGKREFLSLLKTLHKDFVKTIIIVSHDMNIITENCSDVAVFSDGKIYATGSPKSVFLDGASISSGLCDSATAFLTKALLKEGIKVDSDLTVEAFTDAFSALYRGEK